MSELVLNQRVFEQFPVLETRRLFLHELTLKDAQAIFGMRANTRVGQFIARPHMDKTEDAESLTQKARDAFYEKRGIAWAGQVKDTKEMIGTCGFNQIDAQNLHAEIGGEMAVEFWGRKLAQEAVEAIVQFGFNTLGLHTIEAKVSPNNRSAIYLMEQLGFVKEAHYKDRIYFEGTFQDMAVYSCFNPMVKE
jgi:ribosomal-protein-alanine N-acetyltransferase